MADYILRGIDPDLWRQFKKRAAAEGHSLKWLLVALITRYVKHGLSK